MTVITAEINTALIEAIAVKGTTQFIATAPAARPQAHAGGAFAIAQFCVRGQSMSNNAFQTVYDHDYADWG